jgi:hypothetical protein
LEVGKVEFFYALVRFSHFELFLNVFGTCVVLFVKILHKRAIAASDEVRATPDLRTGDIVEIRLVLLIFF